jgi:hypothetical protein
MLHGALIVEHGRSAVTLLVDLFIVGRVLHDEHGRPLLSDPVHVSTRLSPEPMVTVDWRRATMVARVAGPLFSMVARVACRASRTARSLHSAPSWSLQGGHWPCGKGSVGMGRTSGSRS